MEPGLVDPRGFTTKKGKGTRGKHLEHLFTLLVFIHAITFQVTLLAIYRLGVRVAKKLAIRGVSERARKGRTAQQVQRLGPQEHACRMHHISFPRLLGINKHEHNTCCAYIFTADVTNAALSPLFILGAQSRAIGIRIRVRNGMITNYGVLTTASGRPSRGDGAGTGRGGGVLPHMPCHDAYHTTHFSLCRHKLRCCSCYARGTRFSAAAVLDYVGVGVLHLCYWFVVCSILVVLVTLYCRYKLPLVLL